MGGATPAGARFTLFNDFGMRFRTPIAFEAVDAYAKLARRRGLTLTQLALGYVRSRWFVGSTIIGATTMTQLAEDIDAFIDLDATTLAEIAAVQKAVQEAGAALGREDYLAAAQALDGRADAVHAATARVHGLGESGAASGRAWT